MKDPIKRLVQDVKVSLQDLHVRMRKAALAPLIVFTVAPLFLVGCHKANSTANNPAAAADAATNGVPAPPTQSAANAPAPGDTSLTQPDGQVNLPELQRSVIRWVVANRRRPASFEDFAATANVTIPPPPAGKKYIITRELHVQLVDR